ncbi:lactoylglutathione lyase [Deinobacterium chartae]|uniref:Lactoylglutathione lyase n=1 Tax=Deinobacterium chartae TaxID=521158 RepID=A0A841I1R5_9DEIO|nr:VOC family protein [Deinobacterium chartae]MBB6099761.1 lactoylglutathione lyase [Deinobacterium chartae]
MQLKHVSFLTRDADALRRFYAALGATVLKDQTRSEEALRRLVLEVGGGRLQFFQDLSGALQPRAAQGWMEHIALEVSGLDAVISRLLEAGGALLRREPSPSGRDMAFVRDPDGRQLELLERSPS